MQNKIIFFLLLPLFFCNADSLQFHSIKEFKESFDLSQNKKAFIESTQKVPRLKEEGFQTAHVKNFVKIKLIEIYYQSLVGIGVRRNRREKKIS